MCSRYARSGSFIAFFHTHMTGNPSTDIDTLQKSGYNSPNIEKAVPRFFYLLYAIPFLVVVAYIIFVFVYRTRKENSLKSLADIKPKMPPPGPIDESNFEFCGPLKLQSRFLGRVEHALVNDVSYPIEQLAYDENMNEVNDIGSNIEEIEGISDPTMSAQKAKRKSTLFVSRDSSKRPTVASMKAKALLKMRKDAAENNKASTPKE
ncbi:hypothetical protein RB195_013011 [Necator americanus]|uniref:Resistance to inhibitors of cholinesterase protein 3 N-terminal domain-containing protein n=1 Tax=Necator americanus TaxID=51031 RepID=A0ABR1DTL3_NECAM